MQNILLCVSIALIGGLFMSRIVKKVGLPAVTGYLLQWAFPWRNLISGRCTVPFLFC